MLWVISITLSVFTSQAVATHAAPGQSAGACMRVKNAYSSRRDALVSRRDSIRFLAAISAGAFFPLKQTFAAERTSASRIDLHHHYVSNEILWEAIEKQPNPQP